MEQQFSEHKVDKKIYVSFSNGETLDPIVLVGNCSSESRASIYKSLRKNQQYKHTAIANETTFNITPCRDNQQVSVYLLFSHGCPLDCTYCLSSEEGYQKSSSANMSPETAISSIKSALPNLAEEGIIQIIFFGGEPLVNGAKFEIAVRGIEREVNRLRPDVKISWNLTSCLAVLPDGIPKVLKDYGFHILCDVDGPAEIHNKHRPFKNGKGSFEVIRKNINKLQDMDILVSGRATVTSLNVHMLSEVLDTHIQIGFKESALVPVNPYSSGGFKIPEEILPNLDDLYSSLRAVFEESLYPPTNLFPINMYLSQLTNGFVNHTPCGAPDGNIFVFGADAKSWPCIYFVGEPAANLQLSTSYDLQRVLAARKENKCKECGLLPVCQGGCMAQYAYADPKSSEYGNSIACIITRATIDSIIAHRVAEIADKHVFDQTTVLSDIFIPKESFSEVTACILCGCEGCTSGCTYCTWCTYCKSDCTRGCTLCTIGCIRACTRACTGGCTSCMCAIVCTMRTFSTSSPNTIDLHSPKNLKDTLVKAKEQSFWGFSWDNNKIVMRQFLSNQ